MLRSRELRPRLQHQERRKLIPPISKPRPSLCLESPGHSLPGLSCSVLHLPTEVLLEQHCPPEPGKWFPDTCSATLMNNLCHLMLPVQLKCPMQSCLGAQLRVRLQSGLMTAASGYRDLLPVQSTMHTALPAKLILSFPTWAARLLAAFPGRLFQHFPMEL